MPSQAGVPNVIFRFIFGAGTTCNNYDGFAVDDIMIGEAPPNNPSFTYSCTNNNTVAFTNTSALCPSLAWDFGDPASGPNNTSTLANPIHTFSAPGQYAITLTATGPDNGSAVTPPQIINILGVTTSVTNNNCFGDNIGSATVNVIPVSAAPFFYSWNTIPAQTTQTITGLAGGTYTVTVNAINSCQTTTTAIITTPAALAHTVNIVQPGCAVATGTASISATGGTAPYTYSWAPSGGTGSTASGLAPGNYTVTVTDSKACFENINVVIANANTLPAQNTATAINLAAGLYTLTVTDNNGCSASTSVQITKPPQGSCGDVFFPNAFTPNGDALNPDFGALGNVAAISNYLLHIYNRYGELVFYTRNPFVRWNGLYKGKQLSGSYVWVASFMYKGTIKREKQGSVMIIR